ncbi:MAG: hypothetical protein P4L80_05465 [Xanthobacteraceae bacterium]|nr:hypothetical protein [Xanthobacteraceae bacterium]
MTYTTASPKPPVSAGFNLDHALRRLFPSTSRLTFNPLFRWTVNAFGVIPWLVFPEFRGLPPNHLRIRSGVGNRLLNNQSHFLVHARDFWMFRIQRAHHRHGCQYRRYRRRVRPLVPLDAGL